MRRVFGKLVVGVLMMSACAFFFTLSMVATGVNTPLSNAIMFISLPVMIAALIWVNVKDCE